MMRKVKTKFFLPMLLLVLGLSKLNAQNNKELAYSYIRKANSAIEKSIDYSEAFINFNKAVKLLGIIKDKNIASLGARTYYEIHHKQNTVEKQIEFLEKSTRYSRQYFFLAQNKKTNDYRRNVELYDLSRKKLKKLQYRLQRRM